MVRFLLLFVVGVLCPALGLADESLLLGTSQTSSQLNEFIDLLETRLAQSVQLVELKADSVEGWQQVDSPLDLQLLAIAPTLEEARSRHFIGLVPFADGQVGYLYQLAPRLDEQRQLLMQVVAEWMQPYRRQGTARSSALQSVDEAVAAARNGHFSQALTYLYQHLEKHRRDVRAYAETLVVLEWAGRYRDALALALSRADLQFPLYAIKSVIRSVRAGGFFADAEKFLIAGLHHAPEDPELLSLQVHLLADRGRLDEAERLSLQALKAYPQYADLWLAKYYLHVLQPDPYAALDAIQRANELVPSRYARRELFYSLERCGMPQLALSLLHDDPKVLTSDERFRLRRAANAMQIRWGAYEPASQDRHYAETDTALRDNDSLFVDMQSSGLEQEAEHRLGLLFDRLVALRDRRQMRQVVEQWEHLNRVAVALPDYALQAVADALLYLQRPEQAAELYAAIAERQPNNAEAWLGLYYSLHEANQFDQATALIERLFAQQAIWDRSKGYRVPEENPARLRFELAAALDRLYRNELEIAEERLGRLFHNGPHRSELRKAWGDLENARRHPRLAQSLFEQGLAVEPEHGGLQVALADSFMVRRQWRLAEKSIARQVELYPDEGSSLRLEDEWQRYRMRQLEGRISFGFGDSPSVDGQEIDWLLRSWTRPINYDWRLAAFIQNRFGKLPEGRAARTYGGVAFDRKTPELSLFGQLGLADTTGKRLSAELSGRYELSDRWAVLFAAARNGEAVSLRALETGSGGNQYQFGAEWWRNESLSAAVELSLLDYDDGNQRTGLAGSVRRRLQTGPVFQLDNVLRCATSQNSRSGGAYFAPGVDLMVEDGLQARWIGWRRYADTFTQRASLSTGGYWQQNYGWSLPFELGYAHEWELQQRRLFVEYGPAFSRRYYDGVAENNLGLYLAFSWRY